MPHCKSYALVVLLLAVFSLSAQETLFTTFANESSPRIEVKCNWILLNSIRDDTEIEGTAQLLGAEWETELSLRGRFRRAKCDTTMLPFRVQFRKKELRGAGFPEYRNHKIVTPCIVDDEGIQNLQEELLVYRLYNILTDQSFKAVEATLLRYSMNPNSPPDSIMVLVLEPTKEMADRVGNGEVETYNLPADSLDAWSYNCTALFQFMVGNFDWSQKFVQNVKLVKGPKGLIMVPHDFDFSSIVEASYARVPKEFGIYDPKDRVYLGEYFFDQLPEVEQHFIDHKEEMIEYVLAFEGLKKSRRKQIVVFLKNFFKHIEDPEHTMAYKMSLPFNR